MHLLEISRVRRTFCLALDGDVDFQPKAVQKAVDMMQKNPDIGAACGRIHPTGSTVHHAISDIGFDTKYPVDIAASREKKRWEHL